jgi:hypothetical protein
MAFYSLVLPLVFSTLFFAATGIFKKPYLRMPINQTVWYESSDPSHPAFLSRLTGDHDTPDLVVAQDGRFLTEFGVPCFFTFVATRDDGHEYYSSVDLKVLAIVFPDEQQILLKKFGAASRTEQVTVPSGFPYRVYLFDFRARKQIIVPSLEHADR